MVKIGDKIKVDNFGYSKSGIVFEFQNQKGIILYKDIKTGITNELDAKKHINSNTISIIITDIKINNNSQILIGKYVIDQNKSDEALVKNAKDNYRHINAGEVYTGKVVNVMDYGVFINLLPGVDGLLHFSKTQRSKRQFKNDDIISVKVDNIDLINKKISLVDTGFKQTKYNKNKIDNFKNIVAICVLLILVIIMYKPFDFIDTKNDNINQNQDVIQADIIDTNEVYTDTINSPTLDKSKAELVSLNQCTDGDTARFYIPSEQEKLSKNSDWYSSVRFLYIDTPESTKEVEKYGREASAFVCDKLQSANEIYLEYDGNRYDKYDRILAWVWVDGELLQASIAQQGYVEAFYDFGDYKYENYLEQEVSNNDIYNIFEGKRI